MKDIEKLKNQFFASCPVGMEQVLEKEIHALGILTTRSMRGGVEFKCFPDIALNFVLQSKIASRVFKALYYFDIKDEYDLYLRCKEIKWKSVFKIDQTFKIKTIQSNSPNGKKSSKFKSSIFISQKFKDGIVDHFREKEGKRPDVNKVDPEASLIVRLQPHDNEFSSKESVTVLIDLCGSPLSFRGYREKGFPAPLRENLAAGIASMIAEPNLPIVDLMTGSGTFAIETALRLGNIPGTYLRILDHFEFGDELGLNFENLLFFTKDPLLQENFKKILVKAHNQIKTGLKLLERVRIVANDVDSKALNALRKNLENAKLDNIIEVSHRDFSKVSLDGERAIVFANPPYGERLETDADLAPLYHELGEHLKHHFKSSTAYIFTGNLPLIKKIALKTSSKVILHNGNIESRLVKYELF